MTTVTDADVTAAVTNISQELLPRRINFVPAKHEYKMQINDSIVFATKTEHYSICFGGTSDKASSKTRPSIFDSKKLEHIKTWSIRYNIGNGYIDTAKRGFAVSVLYALRACPSFRQFSAFHKETCKRVGCSLCKIFRFFEETENHQTINFPLDLNVFDAKWIPGTPGDSAEFFNQLMNVLQREEIGNSRVFQSINEYTSAIGQMFRIESQNRYVCDSCGRAIPVSDSYWTLFAPEKIENSIKSKKIPVDTAFCDACGKPFSVVEEFKELPYIFTIQLNNWDDRGVFKKRSFQASKYFQINIGDVPYRLCALTTYDGNTSEGGKYSTLFLSSSGTWNIMANGKMASIDISNISKYQPQLLFFTRDQPNVEQEFRSEFVRISPEDTNSKKENEEEEELFENEQEMKNNFQKAADSLTNSIEKQFRKNVNPLINNSISLSKDDESSIIVVDTTNPKTRKVDRKNNHNDNDNDNENDNSKKKLRAAKNPMERLLKSRSVHETATWEGVVVKKDERIEATKGWKEEAPDEWDQSLDMGHQRKIRNKRPPPVENPFDKALGEKRSPDDFRSRNDMFGDRRQQRGGQRGGFRGGYGDQRSGQRGGFRDQRGGQRGGYRDQRGGQRGGRFRDNQRR